MTNCRETIEITNNFRDWPNPADRRRPLSRRVSGIEEIVENDVEFAIPEGGNDMIPEAEKLDTAPPLGMRGNDLPGGNFQR